MIREHTHEIKPAPEPLRYEDGAIKRVAWTTELTALDGAHHLHFITPDGDLLAGTQGHVHPDLSGASLPEMIRRMRQNTKRMKAENLVEKAIDRIERREIALEQRPSERSALPGEIGWGEVEDE